MSARASPRRSPADGGYAPGEAARARIIAAALKVFAQDGYVRASTRRIAAEAGVTPPALQYYFDSKAGLHRACGQFMVERVRGVMSEPTRVAGLALAAGDRLACVEALSGLLDALFLLSLDSSDSPERSAFLVRTQAEGEGPAHALARDGIHAPLYRVCSDLAAAAMGRPAGASEARLTALMLMNLLSAFSVHRDGTLGALGWTDLDGERGAMARASLRDAVHRLLRTPEGD